jgi:hypothetical protein
MDPGAQAADSRTPVRRRQVFFIHGYDPRSPRAYHLLLARELRRFASLNGIAARIETEPEPTGPEEPAVRWTMRAAWPGGPVETSFDLLDWHDIAARDFRMGKLSRFLTSCRVLWYTHRQRGFRVLLGLNWKFGLFSLYPWIMVAAYALAAIGITWGSAVLAGHAGLPALAALLPAALLLLGFAKLTAVAEKRFYVWYLINDWIFTWRQRTRRDPAAEARFEAFARHIAARSRAAAADETLVVAHSSGCFVALAVVDRALRLDPALGAGGRPLGLLTIGSNTPIAAAGDDNPPTRQAIQALLHEERLRWIEYFAPQDILNFPRLDPVKAFGLDDGGRPPRNPQVRSARFSEIFEHRRIRPLRYRFYEMHFQFLAANDIPGEYDFHRFLLGPGRFGDGL